LQRILGIPVYGTKGAVNNRWWYNRGYPRLKETAAGMNDKNGRSLGSGGNVPISTLEEG
jgi:hypothetical protein